MAKLNKSLDLFEVPCCSTLLRTIFTSPSIRTVSPNSQSATMSRTCCFAPSTVCDRLCFGTIILGNQCDNIPICSSSNHSLMARCLLAYLLSIALTVVVPIDRYWIVPSNHHRFMCLFYPGNLFNVGTRRVDLCFYGEFYFQRA